MAQDILVDSITLTLAGGASTTLNHNIKENGVPKVPDRVMPTKATGIVVSSVSSTQVSFNNPGATTLTATFYVQRTISQQMPETAVNQYWAGVDASAGGSGTLQQSYDAGSVGQQVISLGGSSRTGVAIRDAAVAIGSDLFEVTDSGDTVQYLGVDVNGAKTDMGWTLANSTVGVGPVGGVRLRSSGAVLQVSQGGGAYANVLHAGDNTLSSAYAAGSAGVQTMTLDATRLGILLNDAANVGGDLFSVTDGTNPWFAVRNNAVRIGADAIQFRELPGAGPFSLSVVTPAVANTAGYPLLVGSGAGAASDNTAAGGAGATMALFSGNGGAGGAAQLAGIGGPLTITAGDGGSNNGGGGAAGGSIAIQAGVGTGTAAHGDVTIQGGAASATSTTPGSIICLVNDGATAAATDALILYHTSTGTAAANYGTGLRFRGQDAAGTAGGDDLIRLIASFSTATSGAEVTQFLVQTRTAGGAVATTATFAGSGAFTATGVVTGSSLQLTNSSLAIAVVGNIINHTLANSRFGNRFLRTSPSSGSDQFMKWSTGSSTGRTASTEIIEFDFDIGSKQWATGALTTQREVLFRAPTYSFVGASTLTNGATVAIAGAPVQGTNATITNQYAFWVQADKSRFDGIVILNTPNSAIADADLVASSVSWYLNESGNLLVAKAKYADGTTIKTFSGALV